MRSFILTWLVELISWLSLGNVLICITAGLSVWFWLISAANGKKHPPLPGPYRIPYLGSVFVFSSFLSPLRRHKTQVDFAKYYGPICAIQVGKMQVVLLNSIEMVKEAFITKGEYLSDRAPDMGVANMAKGIARENYGKDFKEKKKLTLHSMKDFGLGGKSLDETVREEVQFLVQDFKKEANTGVSTDIHQRTIYLAVSNVICSVVFGRRFPYDDEKFIQAVNSIKYLLSQGTRNLQRIPVLRNLPFVKRKVAERAYQFGIIKNFIHDQIRKHKEDFDGDDPKDFVDLCLQQEGAQVEGGKKSSVDTENLKRIIFDLFIAGTDTTAASLSWFILYMMHFPEVQRKCQEEIDRVSETAGGFGGLTGSNLPYTTATLLETQRISSIAGSSLPHFAREDTVLGEYHVKKGSIVQANIRFLHMDDRYWEAPEVFSPGRWLDPTDPSRIVQHSQFIPFSIGKRRCLGENLAKTEYTVFGITLLRYFSFRMEDSSRPPTLVGRGLVYSPLPYRMLVEERNCND